MGAPLVNDSALTREGEGETNVVFADGRDCIDEAFLIKIMLSGLGVGDCMFHELPTRLLCELWLLRGAHQRFGDLLRHGRHLGKDKDA